MSAWMISERHADTLISLALSGASDSTDWQEYRRPAWSIEPESAYPRRVVHYNGDEHQRTGWMNGDVIEYGMAPDELGTMLLAENVASLMGRYPDSHEEVHAGTAVATYRFTRVKTPTTAEAIKGIHCYAYQACEHEGWETSEARRFCDALEESLISAMPGYESAPWGWD